MNKKYVIVTWPDVQEFLEYSDFHEHSYLINDSKGLEDFGSSAYFVEDDWLKSLIDE